MQGIAPYRIQGHIGRESFLKVDMSFLVCYVGMFFLQNIFILKFNLLLDRKMVEENVKS